MVIESANTDLEMRRHNWRVHGEKGRKPGYAPAVPCCALLCHAVPCCALLCTCCALLCDAYVQAQLLQSSMHQSHAAAYV